MVASAVYSSRKSTSGLVLRVVRGGNVKLSEVLSEVEGLNKRFVYYLEAQGYIQPRKLRKERISRRDYSPADLDRIRGIWAYYHRGYSVQAAEAAARETSRITAWALLPVPTSRWAEALDLVRQLDRVQEASFVYGESADLVLRIAAPEESEVFGVLNSLFDRGVVAGVPQILKTQASFQRDAPEGERKASGCGGKDLQAYVLLKVPVKHAGGALDALRELPEVAEASVVYGETDIIARVVVPDQDSLDEVVLSRIQGLPMVESTRTFLVVGKMQWRRDAATAGS